MGLITWELYPNKSVILSYTDCDMFYSPTPAAAGVTKGALRWMGAARRVVIHQKTPHEHVRVGYDGRGNLIQLIITAHYMFDFVDTVFCNQFLAGTQVIARVKSGRLFSQGFAHARRECQA